MTESTINSIYNQIFDTYPNIELEVHVKKLIELDSFYPYNTTFFCITNTALKSFEYVSKNFTACTGLDAKEMKEGGMNYFWSTFHPDDIQLWIKSLTDLMEYTMNETSVAQRKKMNYTWNYRIKSAKGNYLNIIQNTTPIQFDQENKPIIGLAHYTVLDSNMKMDICASAKYLNENNEYETLFYKNLTTANLLNIVTNREKDIIRLLIINKKSEEIANKLFISKHTVNTHRKNILKKLQLSSTTELISYFKNNPQLI